MMRLIFHSGPLAGTEINTGAKLIRMGRHPDENDLVVDDVMASSRHCVLKRSPRGAYILEDLKSTNGTFVNGQRIDTVYLSAGDRFGIGGTEIEVGEGRPRLMITGGPRAGKDIPIGEEEITIGRAPDNTLEIANPDVSAYHCVVIVHPTGFILQDNGSTNGTLVNGDKVQRVALDDGDSIRVGDTELRFLIDEPERSEADDQVHSLPGVEVALVKLLFVAGPHEGGSVPLGDTKVTFGRRSDCTMVVNDLEVSGLHCAIVAAGAGDVTRVHHRLIDENSRNGTFLNGARVVAPTSLSPGDLIEFGQCVAEFQVTAGANVGVAGQTVMSTVVADGAYEVQSQPKFVINGHVENTARVDIGRAPACQMRLDNDTVSRVHCTVAWEDDGFYVEDSSTYGTYVGDKRIVKQKLQTGHIIKCGPHLINVEIRGDRCTLEEIDAAHALAKIEVARMNQFNLADAVLDPANIGGAVNAAYKTVFKLDVADADALVQKAKAKFKQGAPAWRPSSDIQSSSITKIAVSSAVVASLAVCALLLFVTRSDAALINHPLSDSHASKQFSLEANNVGLSDNCQACHSAGSGVDEAKCVQCHMGFGNSMRLAHVTRTDKVKSHQSLPGSACSSCHLEHEGAPRLTGAGTPTLLGAAESCASESCHPNQHDEQFVKNGPPPPMVLQAGPVPSFGLPQQEFHVAHARVTHNGEDITVGCTACHATMNAQSGELEPSPAGLSCFRCHTGGEAGVRTQCLSCHENEHTGGTDLVRLAADDPMAARVSPAPTTGGSLLVGGGLALAVFLPLCGLAIVMRARRRERSARMIQELGEFPVEIVKRLIHSINVDKCVGCHMCVSACPASVLELVNHKSTVVNFDACIQCKLCEQACAFDALRMHEADKPPPMIQMPEVDAHYQTPVQGMYLIGQASGTPQVKNASNLGRAAVQHMYMEGLRPGHGQAAGAQVDVVIIGSGPAGLSAAITCAQMGLSYLLLEKQRAFAWTVRNYYHKGKEVMAEPNDVEMAGLLPHWDTNREELLAAWEQSIAQYGLQIQYQQNVTDVKKTGDMFTVTVGDGRGNPTHSWSGARAVLAIGTMGNPRKLGCPGEDMEKVHNALVDPDEHRGKSVLVVGGTDSAIEVVLALCENNKVWLSLRSAKFDRVKPANLEKINAAVAAGKVTMQPSTAVVGVGDGTVTLENRNDKSTFELPNDVVFAMIGGHPPIKWLQSLGVPYVEKPHAWSPPRTDELVQLTMPTQ